MQAWWPAQGASSAPSPFLAPVCARPRANASSTSCSTRACASRSMAVCAAAEGPAGRGGGAGPATVAFTPISLQNLVFSASLLNSATSHLLVPYTASAGPSAPCGATAAGSTALTVASAFLAPHRSFFFCASVRPDVLAGGAGAVAPPGAAIIRRTMSAGASAGGGGGAAGAAPGAPGGATSQPRPRLLLPSGALPPSLPPSLLGLARSRDRLRGRSLSLSRSCSCLSLDLSLSYPLSCSLLSLLSLPPPLALPSRRASSRYLLPDASELARKCPPSLPLGSEPSFITLVIGNPASGFGCDVITGM
mmetsp:Transcript_11919/g.29227  ORF Transcript_11919/g.29227 Transcript_11919/m.29227 type:complete len:306 (-) Transcript_11919:151-1068(-)